MRRREFVLGLGGALLGARAARAAARPRVGLLTLSPLNGTVADNYLAFLDGLRALGFTSGQSMEIDYRSADDDYTRLKPLAEALAAARPDVVLALQPSCARAVKAAAPDLPIVCPTLFQSMPDLFAGFAHPGGSVTGIANIAPGLNAKLVEFAAELVPGTTRAGLLVNPNNANNGDTTAEIEAAARTRGIALEIEKATKQEEIAPALDRLAKSGPQPVIVPNNALMIDSAGLIARQALAERLPTVFQLREMVDAGGVLSYGFDSQEVFRRAAYFVATILKGAKPGDLPIETPTRFWLALNLKTAKAIGVTVPPFLIATADQVIE